MYESDIDILYKVDKYLMKRFGENSEYRIIDLNIGPPNVDYPVFVNFDFGVVSAVPWEFDPTGNLDIKLNEYRESRPASFTVIDNHRVITCDMPNISLFNVQLFEALCVVFSSYPHQLDCGDVALIEHNLTNFKAYPDYEFAKLWVERLSNDELESVMELLIGDSELLGPYDLLNAALQQRKVIKNAIYGASSFPTLTRQTILSAKHLLVSEFMKKNTDSNYTEQRAFILKEMNRRGISNNDNLEL